MRSRVQNCGRGDQNFPSFRGRRPWNPLFRGTRPTVDAGGLPSPPSSSRSGDPPRRGRAVRRRYHGGTDRGIPARSARMTCERLNCGAGCAGGRGRVAVSTVILAQRGSPHGGATQCVVVTLSNQQGDCVVAKSAWLRSRLAAKASPAPLLLLFGRDPLRWVRVRDEGCHSAPSE